MNVHDNFYFLLAFNEKHAILINYDERCRDKLKCAYIKLQINNARFIEK